MRRRHTRTLPSPASLLCSLAFALSVTGCGAAPDPGRPWEVRDSAGIEIVFNHLPTPEGRAGCEIAATPTVDIGVAEGEEPYQLYQVFDATRFPDGRIAVVNQGSSELRFFDAAGSFIRSIGGEGDGPGEFRNVRMVWRLPQDSLLVWDRSPQRFSTFSPTGEFVSGVAINPIHLNPPDILTWTADGRILAAYHHLDIEESGFTPQLLYLLAFDRNGELQDTLGTFAYGRLGRVGDPDARMAGSPLFQAQTSIAASPHRTFVGRGPEAEAEVYESPHQLRRLIRWTAEDLQVSREDVDRLLANRLATSDDPGYQRLIRATVEEVPVSDRFPAVQRLFLDEAGNLWMMKYPQPRDLDRRDWLVFDPEGIFLCAATFPGSLQVHEIGEDYVLASEDDDFGVEHVKMFGLHRPTRSGGE